MRQRRRQFSAAVPGRGRGQCFGSRPAWGRVGPGDGRMTDRSDGVAETLELSQEDELKMLVEEEQMIRQQLEEVSAAIEALRKKNDKEVE